MMQDRCLVDPRLGCRAWPCSPAAAQPSRHVPQTCSSIRYRYVSGIGFSNSAASVRNTCLRIGMPLCVVAKQNNSLLSTKLAAKPHLESAGIRPSSKNTSSLLLVALVRPDTGQIMLADLYMSRNQTCRLRSPSYHHTLPLKSLHVESFLVSAQSPTLLDSPD